MDRAVQGMPGSSEYLEELMSRVFGDYMHDGWVIIIADDINVGANTVEDLIDNWVKVLQRLQENNLSLSASKTFICPKKVLILGWVWEAGSLSASPHKIAPLTSVAPSPTCSSMRSFIGAFKALAKCIPRYASLVSPLEDSIKGLQGAQRITWTTDLYEAFQHCQDALKTPRTITIPRPDDKLILTVDASPLNNGISGTLFISHNKRLLAGFFSLKLKTHQRTWKPCELEALAIAGSIKFFELYIRESTHPLQVLTDNRPCVQAFHNLCKGHFSASARISSFLSTLSLCNVVLSHLKGTANQSSNFSSRNPMECGNSMCEVCKFVEEVSSSVVKAVSVSDIFSGSACMPFQNHNAWCSTQHACPDLRRSYAHLTKGTRPPRNSPNLKDLRCYLNVASVNQQGLLIVTKPDPFTHMKNLVIVPRDILPGLITALHLYFKHPTAHQLGKVFNRYFYGLNSKDIVSIVTSACNHCNSLKRIPDEIFEQTSSPSPSSQGEQFSVDVVRRNKQMIVFACDILSSYTTSTFVPDEKANSLRSAILNTTGFLRKRNCIVRVDNAPGFLPLKDDYQLKSCGISLDYGNPKNCNKNPVIDKGIQEFESEILRYEESNKTLTPDTLRIITDQLNQRIRNRGLSSKEIIF